MNETLLGPKRFWENLKILRSNRVIKAILSKIKINIKSNSIKKINLIYFLCYYIIINNNIF